MLRIVWAGAIACASRSPWIELLASKSVTTPYCIVRVEAKRRHSVYCDALHRVHRPLRERSRCSMHGARRPAEPPDAQDNALCRYSAHSSQIRLRCSDVEEDKVGTFANSFALLTALDAAGCSIGDSAEEILARPAFTVSTAKADGGAFCGVGRRTRLSDRHCAAGGHFCARSTIRFRACGSRGSSATQTSVF